MDKIIKLPRGGPPTNKTKEAIKAAPRGRPPNTTATPNKTTPPNKAATATNEIIKSAPRGRPTTNKEVPPKEQTDDSIQKQMDKPESIVKSQQIWKSKTLLDIPKIKENEREEEKTNYKTYMQSILRERLRQGKAKLILDQSIIHLQAIMNGLYYSYK